MIPLQTRVAWLHRTALVAIALLCLFRAAPSVRMQHANGDQRVYVGVAMKLEHFGAAGYELRGIGMRRAGDLIVYEARPGERGDLLAQFQSEGVPSYDRPLLHAPPLFATLVWMSHRALGPAGQFGVLAFDRAQQSRMSWKERWRMQGYAVVVPALAALLFVVTVGLTGRIWRGEGVALLAALSLAASPALTLVSRRVWADSTLAALVSIAVFAFWWATRTGRLRLFAVAGVAFGGALLTKNNALLALLPMGVCLFEERAAPGRSSWRRGIPLFLVLALALSAPWYLRVISVFGTPFANIQQEGIAAVHPWFAFINARPWFTYLVGIPYQIPLFALGYVAVARGLLPGPRPTGSRMLSVWALGTIVLLTVAVRRSEMLGPDHRYALPCYPALALLSAAQLGDLSTWVRARGGRGWAIAAVVGIVVASVAWSLWIASTRVEGDLILAPF